MLTEMEDHSTIVSPAEADNHCAGVVVDAEKPKRRAGAPVGNINGMTHGARSKALRCPVGNLPKRMRRISNDLVGMRSALESATLTRHGEISETRALLIQTALRAEQSARACQWQLRYADQNGQLDTAALVSLLKLQVESSRRRDEAVAKLDLDKKVSDGWKAAFDAPAERRSVSPDASSGETPECATEGENTPQTATETPTETPT